MKKLLLAVAGLSVIGATAQEVRTDLGRSSEMYTASHADGIPYKTSANKQSSAVAIGTAPNVYGAGFGPKTNIWANEDLNTIAFVHRSDYSSNGDNSSGSLRFDYSTNGGATWTANAGPVWNPTTSGYAYPGAARYPRIGILNETGNTNPLNASIAVWAPTLVGTNGGAWGGALMGTHKMDNTTTNVSVDTTGGHLTLDNSNEEVANFDTSQSVGARSTTNITGRTVWIPKVGKWFSPDGTPVSQRDAAIMFPPVRGDRHADHVSGLVLEPGTSQARNRSSVLTSFGVFVFGTASLIACLVEPPVKNGTAQPPKKRKGGDMGAPKNTKAKHKRKTPLPTPSVSTVAGPGVIDAILFNAGPRPAATNEQEFNMARVEEVLNSP